MYSLGSDEMLEWIFCLNLVEGGTVSGCHILSAMRFLAFIINVKKTLHHYDFRLKNFPPKIAEPTCNKTMLIVIYMNTIHLNKAALYLNRFSTQNPKQLIFYSHILTPKGPKLQQKITLN